MTTTTTDLILKYFPKLLPEIKISPLPEIIFLSTIKALVVPAASLSRSQWETVGILLFLTNASPALRKATVKLYGYLSLIIGAEIALINVYVLICSWISPSSTLQPLTVVILNVLNSIVPLFTDSLTLFHLLKEKASHSDSRVSLASTLSAAVLLKCVRLAGAVMYMHSSAEFIISSFTLVENNVTPNMTIMDTARVWNTYISSGLQLVDNVYSLGVHWAHAITVTRSVNTTTHPDDPLYFIWSFGSQYILPIVLNAGQLAISPYIQSNDAPMLIDSAKVVINIVAAARTTLRKHFSDLPVSSAHLRNTRQSIRDMTKVPVPPVTFPGTMEELHPPVH